MSITTLGTVDKVLKTVYLDVINESINFSVNPFLAQIKKSTSDICGKQIKKVIRQGVTGGIGAGSEDGVLPTPYPSLFKEMSINLKNLYGTIEFSDKLLRMSHNTSGAVIDVVNDEMETLVKSASLNFGRMLFGDGSGVLGTIRGKDGNLFICDDVKNFLPGTAVQVYSSDFEPLYEGKTFRVLSIDRDNKKVRINGTFSESHEGCHIMMQNAYNNEITGLKAIFDVENSLYGNSRDIDSFLLPRVINNVGEISEMVIQEAIDKVEEDTGSKIDYILCSSGVKRAFMHHLSTYKRNPDVMNLNGGYKAISYNGIPIISDRFCPEGTMYLLNSKDFTLHQLCDWEWLEDDKGSILRQFPDKPVYKATIVKYAELLCSRPCGQAMLTGITEM